MMRMGRRSMMKLGVGWKMQSNGCNMLLRKMGILVMAHVACWKTHQQTFDDFPMKTLKIINIVAFHGKIILGNELTTIRFPYTYTRIIRILGYTRLLLGKDFHYRLVQGTIRLP